MVKNPKTLRNFQLFFTVKNFKEDFPVAGDIDVFLVHVKLEKHRAWVFPCLLPESKPTRAPTQDSLDSVWVSAPLPHDTCESVR